jgi:hypothetical protein
LGGHIGGIEYILDAKGNTFERRRRPALIQGRRPAPHQRGVKPGESAHLRLTLCNAGKAGLGQGRGSQGACGDTPCGFGSGQVSDFGHAGQSAAPRSCVKRVQEILDWRGALRRSRKGWHE